MQTASRPYHADFQTPPPVCQYMASLVTYSSGSILEPTPGIGNLVKALECSGFKVTAPNDFFRDIPGNARFDACVLNPPFSPKYADLRHAPPRLHRSAGRIGYAILSECMGMADEVIALMPWATIIDSDVRLRGLHKYGLRSITSLPRKTFQYARIQTAVFHLKKGYRGQCDFRIYERLKGRQSELFDTKQLH